MKRSRPARRCSSRSSSHRALGVADAARRSRPSATDDHARHARLVRGLEVGARGVHRSRPACTVKVLQARRRRHRAEPGDPHQGRPARRRASSASTTRSSPARSTTDIFEPYAPPALDARARRSSSSTRPHHLTPIDYGDVCVNYDKEWFAQAGRRGPDDARRPHRSPRTRARSWSRTRRRRRPGSRSCSRPSPATATTAGATTGRSCATTTCKVVDGWEEAYNGDFTAGRQRGHLPARRVVRVEPAGRGVLLGPAAEDLADRHAARLLLPPGRVRRRARRAPSTGAAARKLVDFMLSRAVPGRHPAPDVRVPGARGHAAPAGVHEVRRRSPPTR